MYWTWWNLTCTDVFHYVLMLAAKMIIPVRCFTCGKVIGNKWEAYLSLLQADYTEGYSSLCLALYGRSVTICPDFPGHFLPSPPLDKIRVMMIVWILRGNIIRIALCWIVWQEAPLTLYTIYIYNVRCQYHTYMNSSYKSNTLGSLHWDPYAMHRGGCLELYYCNVGVVLVRF